MGLRSKNKALRNESSNISFYSGMSLQGADGAMEREVSFYFEALQNRTILLTILKVISAVNFIGRSLNTF